VNSAKIPGTFCSLPVDCNRRPAGSS